MSFAAPWVLALIPPALLLWLFATRPRRRKWSSVLLLERVLATAPARRLVLPKLQRVLLGVALLAAIFALARPERQDGPAPHVLVHDGRASLLTRVQGVSGIERATTTLRTAMGEPVRVLMAEDTQGALANLRAKGEIGVLVTDRPEVTAPADAGFIQLAHAVGNAGITRLSLSAGGLLQVTARQRSPGTERTLTVQISAATGHPRILCEQIFTAETFSRSIPDVVLRAGEILEARVGGGDALPEDDVATLRLARGPVRVHLGPDSAPSLVRALKAQTDVSFVREDADLGVGGGKAGKMLRVAHAGVQRRVRGVVAGSWADESAGEALELALHAAPASVEVHCTLASEPLLVGSAGDLLLLADPEEMAAHAALPLMVRDILAHLGSSTAAVNEGVLDADATAGARTTTETWRAPSFGSAQPVSLAPWFLTLVALLLVLWFTLHFLARTSA